VSAYCYTCSGLRASLFSFSLQLSTTTTFVLPVLLRSRPTLLVISRSQCDVTYSQRDKTHYYLDILNRHFFWNLIEHIRHQTWHDNHIGDNSLFSRCTKWQYVCASHIKWVRRYDVVGFPTRQKKKSFLKETKQRVEPTNHCQPIAEWRRWRKQSTNSQCGARAMMTDYNTLHHTATHYITLQHTTSHCNTQQTVGVVHEPDGLAPGTITGDHYWSSYWFSNK